MIDTDKVLVPESHRDLLDVQTGAFATIEKTACRR